MYWVAGPSEVLAITGWGIADISLAKKKWVWPGQKVIRVGISPVNYTFQVQAMSAEKLPFILPAVFTIGPRVDSDEAMLKFAKLISPHDKLSNYVKELVQGVIEGETRVLAASMTMEEIFKGTKQFKQEVFDKVQLELDQFGLLIYNANVKQLVDVPGHEYFSYLGQKTQMEAANQARIDVSEAKMKGEIGSKQREGQTTQNAAKIDAETKIIATKRQGEGKKEEVRVKAEVESAKAVALREAELQRVVEQKNALTRTEKLKAEHLSKASVEYEIKFQYNVSMAVVATTTKERNNKGYRNVKSGYYAKAEALVHVLLFCCLTYSPDKKVQEANWELYKKQKEAEAVLFKQQKEAEAKKATADAAFYTQQQVADGALYAKQKEADGIAAIADAQGLYLKCLLKEVNGNYAALRDYIMINNGVFQEITKIYEGAQ
ncbi:hypothetical protein RHSIM_Rhsim08G0209000 [Rhododendron simsii]|uniref:Flotillin-like n=1 Tax=Rhododendron simsii TaxID=118357 RepID=A0A834GJX0_RHOSS|nr:hypothetical protein RHSIM_Rhsim08G0209000 [Rhododendron simsii]